MIAFLLVGVAGCEKKTKEEQIEALPEGLNHATEEERM